MNLLTNIFPMFSLRNSFLSILGNIAIFGLLFSISTPTFSASLEAATITSSGSSIQKLISVNVTNITTDSADVEWGKADGSQGYIVYYDVKSSPDNKYTYYSPVVVGTGTVLKNLTPNTTYYLVVKTFDNHANEMVISEEIKFSTIQGSTAVTTNQEPIKNENNLQNPTTTTSPPSSIDGNSPKNQILDTTIKNNSTSGSVNKTLLGTEQIKKLPKTGPTSYVIVVLAFIISGGLIIFLKKRNFV